MLVCKMVVEMAAQKVDEKVELWVAMLVAWKAVQLVLTMVAEWAEVMADAMVAC